MFKVPNIFNKLANKHYRRSCVSIRHLHFLGMYAPRISKYNDLQSAAIHLLVLKLTAPPGCSCQGNIYCPRQKSVLIILTTNLESNIAGKNPVLCICDTISNKGVVGTAG